MRHAHIGVVGAGSIGTKLARGLSRLGHEVVINDVDGERTAALRFDARSKEWIAEHCDYAIFALPTPTDESGGDASIVEQALRPFRGTDATVCLRSTMPPGSTARLADIHDLPLVYSPEFMRDRASVEDFFQRDRMVFAGPKPQRRRVRELFDVADIDCDTIFECEDYLTAEIAKEAHNAFFATKVSFANQLRLIAEQTGADPETVLDIIIADSRNTDSHLDPMLGPYGGKCLPKDTEALTQFAHDAGVPTPLLRGTIDTNVEARRRFDNREIEGRWPNIQPADSD
jgi:UDPglucose 6-dehydrogenase